MALDHTCYKLHEDFGKGYDQTEYTLDITYDKK